MKAAAMIFSILAFSHSANAARTCASYITDEWPDSRYTVETIFGDNVVTDNKTGLMWKQCSEGLTGTDCTTGNATAYFWQEALVLSDTIDVTGFAGFSDWRLPNIEELRSIKAINCYDPSINETVFPNTPSFTYWSSSPVVDDESDVWVTYFDYRGDDHYYRGFRSCFVRLVRTGF
jgi:hypothetical protein